MREDVIFFSDVCNYLVVDITERLLLIYYLIRMLHINGELLHMAFSVRWQPHETADVRRRDNKQSEIQEN